ncbi:MAG: DUF3726 domain-containing protein [Pseudomonadota bacterium]
MSDPTIQSPAGPADDATGAWQVSLAEIDAMGRKAARGAGFSWGLAEEAGRAARWLAAYRLPGPEALAAALTEIDGAVRQYAPHIDGALWRSHAGPLCPVATGAALSDRADRIAEGAACALGPVLHPILVVPFLCRAARDISCMIAMEGNGIRLVATAEGPVAFDWRTLQAQARCRLTIGPGFEAFGEPLRPGPEARIVSVSVWRVLDRFAQRTYVPATEASRQAGAGAGAGNRD